MGGREGEPLLFELPSSLQLKDGLILSSYAHNRIDNNLSVGCFGLIGLCQLYDQNILQSSCTDSATYLLKVSLSLSTT